MEVSNLRPHEKGIDLVRVPWDWLSSPYLLQKRQLNYIKIINNLECASKSSWAF